MKKANAKLKPAIVHAHRTPSMPAPPRRRDELRRGGFSGSQGGGERVATRKRRCHGERRGRATSRRGLEAALDGAFDGRVERSVHGGRRAVVVFRAKTPVLGQRRFMGEGGHAAKELVEHEAQPVEIALGRGLGAFELLGRHVSRCSRQTTPLGLVRRAREDRESEVGDAHVARAVEHDVGGFEVAVHDPSCVGRGQPRAQLARDLERLVVGQTTDATQERRQILAVDELHRQERQSIDLTDVVDTADVGVRHLPGGANLFQQTLVQRRIMGRSLRQELERDLLVQLQVMGAIHLAHSPGSDPTGDAVALCQDLPHAEAARMSRFILARPGTHRSRAAPGLGLPCAAGRHFRRLYFVQREHRRRRPGHAAVGTSASIGRNLG